MVSLVKISDIMDNIVCKDEVRSISGKEFQDNEKEKQALDNNIQILANGGGFMCSICKKISKKKSNMKVHITSVHLTEEPKQCDSCEKQLKNMRSLKDHINREHRNYLKDDQETIENPCLSLSMMAKLDDGTGYRCTMCDKVLLGPTARGNLKQHVISMHMSDTAKDCYICGRILKNEAGLSRHIGGQHRNPNPKHKECTICGKVLMNGGIYEHIRRHKEDPDFTFRALARKPRQPLSNKLFKKRHKENKKIKGKEEMVFPQNTSTHIIEGGSSDEINPVKDNQEKTNNRCSLGFHKREIWLI